MDTENPGEECYGSFWILLFASRYISSSGIATYQFIEL
jgi:hypothetical protein